MFDLNFHVGRTLNLSSNPITEVGAISALAVFGSIISLQTPTSEPATVSEIDTTKIEESEKFENCEDSTKYPSIDHPNTTLRHIRMNLSAVSSGRIHTLMVNHKNILVEN